MKYRLLFLCAASMPWMSALYAGNGDVMATSNPTAFRVYTTADATKAVTLTFVSPDGAETTLNLSGTGATSFLFDKSEYGRCFLLWLTARSKSQPYLSKAGLLSRSNRARRF